MVAAVSLTPARPSGTVRSVTAPSGAVEDAPVEIELRRQRYVRSPADVLRLLVGLGLLVLGLAVATFARRTIGGLEGDVINGFAALPDRVKQILVGVAQLVAVVLPLVALAVVVSRFRLRLLGTLVLGTTGGAFLARVIVMILGERVSLAPTKAAPISTWLVDPSFPTSTYLAAATAFAAVLSPWIARRWRRVVWGWVVLLVALRILASVAPAFDVVLAMAVGLVVGAGVLLIFGSPSRSPTANELVDGIRSAGIEPGSVRAVDDHRTTRRYIVRTRAGTPVFVKLRTPDDRDADLLVRLYRWLRFRGADAEPPIRTLRQRVEHEALLLALAQRAGARTPALVGVGSTSLGSELLVMEVVDGRPVTPDDLDADFLADLWREIGNLHDSRLAHRNLTLDNVLVDTQHQAWLVGFDRARAAAPARLRARDVAALLVELSMVIGVEPAVDSAVRALGPAHVNEALPLLQPLALPRAARRALGAHPGLLDDLTRDISLATSAPPVKLERLERVQPRTLLTVIAATAAFYFLLPQLTDLQATLNAFRHADWAWIPVLLAATVLSFFFAAIAFAGAAPEEIPFSANLRAQLASSFVGKITPANAGGVALGIRFLQREGVDPPAAAAASSLNAATGVVVHLALLPVFLTWSGRTDVGGFHLPKTSILLSIAAALVGVTLIGLAIPAIRQRAHQPTMRAVRSAGVAIAGVATSPMRIGALVGGSAGVTLSYITALVAAVYAFGGSLTIPQIGAAYLVAAAIGSASPTPGGLGALEAALVATLTGFGMSSGVAVSAVLTFRLATFWLPVLPGWACFTWMQRREEL